jgi:hypothetical protein
MDREDAWEEWERTTAIIKIEVNTQPGGVNAFSTPIATISGHAIARWYQRSVSRDQAKLLMDLGYLMHSREPKRVQSPSGVWCSHIIRAHSGARQLVIRNVRTFVDHDMIDAPEIYTHVAVPEIARR